jgi:hypothetical protein
MQCPQLGLPAILSKFFGVLHRVEGPRPAVATVGREALVLVIGNDVAQRSASIASRQSRS